MSKSSARGRRTLNHGFVNAGKNLLQRDLHALAAQNPAVAKAAAEVDRVTDEIIARFARSQRSVPADIAIIRVDDLMK